MKTASRKFESASSAYARNVDNATELLAKIEAALIAKGDCRTKNWGHVGDVAYVAEKLQEIMDHLDNKG